MADIDQLIGKRILIDESEFEKAVRFFKKLKIKWKGCSELTSNSLSERVGTDHHKIVLVIDENFGNYCLMYSNIIHDYNIEFRNLNLIYKIKKTNIRRS